MKEKGSIVERLRAKITPEYLEKRKQEQIDQKNSLTAEWQLGFYVGEDIVHHFLPTLSVEQGTIKVIPVSSEDELEYKRREELWSDKYNRGKNEAKEEWESFQQLRKELQAKYLPNPLQCHLPVLNIRNMDEFKSGLISSLWNSDVCSYELKPENIKIYEEDDSWFTVIEFELRNEI